MRLTVLILLVTVSCCLAHKGRSRNRYRNNKYYKPIRPTIFPPFTTTPRPQSTTTKAPPPSRPISMQDDILSASIGVRLPPKECVISYQDFVMNVVDMDWISPYVIDNDYPINPVVSWKWSPRWMLKNDTHVQRLGSYWDNLEGQCAFLDSLFKRVDDTKAIIGTTSGTGAFLTAQRKDYFVSFNSANYVIQYICFTGEDRGRCKDSEILLLVKEQRTRGSDSKVTGEICLDDIDWSLIEATFRNCLGQQFVDDTEPQIMWIWENDGEETEDCAKP